MAIGNTPQNQLDALPLIGASQVANPTDVVVVGGNVVRFWDEVATGINGVQRTNAGDGTSNLFSNFLDLRGMNSGLFQVARVSTVGGLDATSMGGFCLYRQGSFGNQISNASIGAYSKQLVAHTWNVTPPGTELLALGWTNSGIPNGAEGTPAMTSDAFFVFHWTVVSVATISFSIRIWAQSC